MAKRVFQPLKKANWSKIQREKPKMAPNGRVIETVRIGISYEKGGADQQDVFEDIYADLLADILAVHKPLRMVVNITCTPKIIIFDGSDIIPHNPQIPGYITEIEKILPSTDEELYYRAYLKGWEMTALKKPMDYSVRAIVQEVSEKTGNNFPPELIIALMRKREAEEFMAVEEESKIKEGIALLDDDELKIAAGDIVAAGMFNGTFNSSQLTDILQNLSFQNEEVVDAVIQEVFKRYILS